MLTQLIKSCLRFVMRKFYKVFYGDTYYLGLELLKNQVNAVVLSHSINGLHLEKIASLPFEQELSNFSKYQLSDIEQFIHSLLKSIKYRKLTLVCGISLRQVFSNIVQLNKELGEHEVQQYLHHNFKRTKRFAKQSFEVRFQRVSSGSDKVNYYVAACEHHVLSNAKQVHTKIKADKKCIELDSQAILRAISVSTYQPLLAKSDWVFVFIKGETILLMMGSKSQLYFEQAIDLSEVGSVNVWSLEHFIIKTITNKINTIPITQPYHLLWCSDQISSPEYQQALISNVLAKECLMHPVKLAIFKTILSSENIDNTTSLTDIIIPLGLALKTCSLKACTLITSS